MKTIYVVTVSEYDGDSEYKDEIFATYDVDKALDWVKRYNKIVSNYTTWLYSFLSDSKSNKRKSAFWETKIIYLNPVASVVEIEIR